MANQLNRIKNFCRTKKETTLHIDSTFRVIGVENTIFDRSKTVG